LTHRAFAGKSAAAWPDGPTLANATAKSAESRGLCAV